MTLTELNERIKEEVVLHDGDLKEWQWRRNGLLTEAEQDGIASSEFMRLVNNVSYQVGGLFPRINALKASAEAYARADKKQLLPLHIEEIVTEAERLTLSRSFVTKRWLPAILATIPDPPKSEPVAVAAPLPLPFPVAPSPPPVPTTLSRDDVRRQITAKLDTYKSDGKIPSWLLRDLVQATRADELVVTEEIFSYLVSNFYKAVQEPQGNSLRERLISTDWKSLLPGTSPGPVTSVNPDPYRAEPSRVTEPQPIVRSFTAQPARVHKGESVTLAWEVENLLAVTIDDLGEGLSPQNRGWVKPVRTTDYTLFDANNNPLSTVRVEVIRGDRSGIYGVLFALALLALIYWFIKHTNSEKPERNSKQRTEQTTSRATNMPTRVADLDQKEDVATDDKSAEKTPPPAPAVEPEPALTAAATTAAKEEAPAKEPVPVTNAPEKRSPSRVAKPDYAVPEADKPYDLIDNRTDEQGWHVARKGKRWGYIGQDDEWVIEPQFEAATPFRGSTATVFLNGQLININRSGEHVRN